MKVKNQPKKSKIPYIFIAFFAVIIVVNLGYIYIAKKTWRGVATDQAYQKGLTYNETLKQEEKQKELGWNIGVKVENPQSKNLSLFVKIIDRNSFTVKDAIVEIFFKNPVQEGYDFSASPVSTGGAYIFDVTFPLKGQWDAIIVVKKGTDKIYLAKRYVVQ